ncbi:MAG TPA: hypothetical protein DDZ22_03275 [Massilia sp.]|nr:hypothetical protein [Massilia sp.]
MRRRAGTVPSWPQLRLDTDHGATSTLFPRSFPLPPAPLGANLAAARRRTVRRRRGAAAGGRADQFRRLLRRHRRRPERQRAPLPGRHAPAHRPLPGPDRARKQFPRDR